MINRIKNAFQFANDVIQLTRQIDILIDYKIRSNLLLNSVWESNESIIQKPVKGEIELIVSLTTHSKRIHDVHLVIESISRQTIKPNRVILWLDEDEYNIDTIPRILFKQVDRGLEIRFCKNYRSFKKLIPTLQRFPESNIITIDDDIIYPHDLIEIFLKENKKYPECILGNRAHRIKVNEKGSLLPYKEWEYESSFCDISDFTFITGCGGVLYPKNCFNDEVFNSKEFLFLCPNADDIWFKAMALLNGTKSKKVDDSREFKRRFIEIANSQDIALRNLNVENSLNDEQLNAVFNKYNINSRSFT